MLCLTTLNHINITKFFLRFVLVSSFTCSCSELNVFPYYLQNYGTLTEISSNVLKISNNYKSILENVTCKKEFEQVLNGIEANQLWAYKSK